jgi:hypothetical protein
LPDSSLASLTDFFVWVVACCPVLKGAIAQSKEFDANIAMGVSQSHSFFSFFLTAKRQQRRRFTGLGTLLQFGDVIVTLMLPGTRSVLN